MFSSFFSNYLSIQVCFVNVMWVTNRRTTFWRLVKVAIFTTNVNAENQTLINHKTVAEHCTATFAKRLLQAGLLLFEVKVKSIYWVCFKILFVFVCLVYEDENLFCPFNFSLFRCRKKSYSSCSPNL